MKIFFIFIMLNSFLIAFDNNISSQCSDILPNPNIVYVGSEYNEWIDLYYHEITVSNRYIYDNSMFVASPELPSCGLNTNSSRSWIKFYEIEEDGSENYFYGFCALNSSNDLKNLWFTAISKNENKNLKLKLKLYDRLCDRIYESNIIKLKMNGEEGKVINSSYTQFELNSTIEETKFFCKNNPTQCGIDIYNENVDTKNVKLELGVGWNLVSVPGYTSYPIEELFAPEEGMAITSSIKSVWVYDKGLAKWLTYVPGGREGTLINLYPGQGFWVNNKFNMNFEFSGQVQKEDLIYKGDGLGDIEKPPGVGN